MHTHLATDATLLIAQWSGLRPATCMPDACFCEAIRAGAIAQPANTWSGLAFIAAAGWIASRRTDSPEESPLPALFGITALILGAGTMLYHASLTFWAQTLDVFGMYLVVTLVLFVTLARRRAIPTRSLISLFALSNGVLLASLILVPQARRYVFAVLVLATIAAEIATRKRSGGQSNRLFASAVVLLAFGFLLWIIDYLRVACAPESWLQGHAAWHLCGAAALVFVFSRHMSCPPGIRPLHFAAQNQP